MKNNTGYILICLFLGLLLIVIPLNIRESRAYNTNYDLDSINTDIKVDDKDNNITDDKENKDNEKSLNTDMTGEENSDNKPNNNDEIKKKYVALTFDDGPSRFTKEIIDLLKKYEYNATFFVLGNKLNVDYTDILKESINNGNEIGIHGFSHKSFTRLKTEALEEEITKSKKYVYNLTEYMPNLVRPPYGNINNNIRNLNLGPYILWNNDTLDWKLRDTKKIYERLINSIEENNIILMHDTYLTTYKALELILPYLKENNYEVVTVSTLFSKNGKTLENNKSYRYAT
ncbi:MAG: polysaccharide deacetylase family protein [Bacilli bacterium]|nr:polysaccharide deacetylase family protein [Bacilli bacterium]